MGQPKKLTHKMKIEQKIEQQFVEKITYHSTELSKIKKAMMNKTYVDLSTWRWAALEIFRTISADPALPHTNPRVCAVKDLALSIAREAQGAMNFLG